MNEDCIFCKIADKKIPAKIEYEDDLCISFQDINPRAKVHLLVIPKKHISTLNDMEESDEKTAGRLLSVAKKVAQKNNLPSYKLLVSVGKAAGQEVFHLHMHVMSPN
jgi:histidine triad (HIT) family protein